MTEYPKVFISYSHDSPTHKQWVSELGAKLRNNGIDVILDQWDLHPGDDMTRFIDAGVKDSGRVLVICTDSYVRKASAGEGGVGYERLIVTAQLVQDLGTNKFIPIVRQASGKEKVPVFFGTRIYIDFTDESQFDEKFKVLLHELHQVPMVQKPNLGKSPFARLPSGEEAPPFTRSETQPPEIPDRVESVTQAYSTAIDLARAADVLGWRQLLKRIRPGIFKSFVQWRQNELEEQLPEKKDLVQVVDKAVDIVSPLIAVALAGVESGRDQFKDQKSLLDDLLNIAEWNRSGYIVWIDIPNALGYVYHSLHGALSLSTKQINLALALAKVKVPSPYNDAVFCDIWEEYRLMGVCKSLGENSGESWKYIISAYERWEWLSEIFTDDLEYRSSLVAYYVALHIHELAAIIASGKQEMLSTNAHWFPNVPLVFIYEGEDISMRAISMLRDQTEIEELWTSLNVTRGQMETSWESWTNRRIFELQNPWLRNPVIIQYIQHFFETL